MPKESLNLFMSFLSIYAVFSSFYMYSLFSVCLLLPYVLVHCRDLSIPEGFPGEGTSHGMLGKQQKSNERKEPRHGAAGLQMASAFHCCSVLLLLHVCTGGAPTEGFGSF